MQIVNKDNQIASMYKNFEEKAREMDGRLAEKDNALDAKQHEYEKISLILREAERKGVVKKVRETPMMDCLQATMESFNTLQAPRRPAGEEVILDGGVRIQTPVPTVPTKSQRKVRKWEREGKERESAREKESRRVINLQIRSHFLFIISVTAIFRSIFKKWNKMSLF